MKDYDAIAREKQEDDVWRIFSIQYNRNNEPWRFTIAGGINGDGPAYIVGVIEGREFTEEICEAHNAAILRKHDEAEAGGELNEVLDEDSARALLYVHGLSSVELSQVEYALTRRLAPTDEKALRKSLANLKVSHIDKDGRADHCNTAYVRWSQIAALLAREAPKDKHPVTYPKKHVTDGSRKGLVIHAPKDESKEVHDKTCRKAPHVGEGHLHGEDDDTPYYVDNVKYCGRCHMAI